MVGCVISALHLRLAGDREVSGDCRRVRSRLRDIVRTRSIQYELLLLRISTEDKSFLTGSDQRSRTGVRI